MILQVFINGLLLGGVYTLVALGMTMIFGVMRVVNIAHGEFLMLGSYITFWLFALLGMNAIVSMVVSAPLIFIAGFLIQQFFIRYVARKAKGADFEMITALLTFGLSILIANVALYAWTADYRGIRYMTKSLKLGGLAISTPRLLTFGVALGITVLFFAFLKRHKIGKSIRAIAQNRDLSVICGVDVERIDYIAFGLGAALAAIAGSLISIIYPVYPEMGGIYLLKAFCVIILGGMGSFLGAFFGSLILGLSESYGALFLPTKVADLVAYAILIIVLLVRPSGILGEKG